jgi:hypothetical protein
VRNLPDQLKQNAQGQLARNNFVLLSGSGGFQPQFEGRQKVGDADADVIALTREGDVIRLFVGADGKVLKKAYRGPSPMGGTADIEEVYSDYRDVSGLSVPHRLEVSLDGQKFADTTVTEVKINSGVAAEELARRPAQ